MAGANFDLQSAQRIIATVRKIEAMSATTDGQPNPARAPATRFHAMLTGCDTTGTFYDFISVMPASGAIADPLTSSPANLSNGMWDFAQPYFCGWGCAREANGNQGVQIGCVVELNFIGYAIPQVQSSSGPAGTSTVQGATPSGSIAPDGSIPFFVFSYPLPLPTASIPLHDHRDNVTGGGFAFSVYHPGTALPQQPWAI